MDYSDSILRIAIAAFDQAAHFTNLFVVPVTIARIAYLNVSGSASSDYSRLMKGVVLYFVLIYSYEPILKLLLSIPADLLPSFDFGASAGTGDAPSTFGDHVKAIMPNILSWSLESLIILLYYAAQFLNYTVAILLSSMAPVIFLLGGILNIGLGVGTFLSLLVMLCCWPIVFIACEAMRHSMAAEMPSLTAVGVSELIIGICKLIGPIAMAKSAIQSPVGQAMKSVASAGHSGASATLNQLIHAKAGYQDRDFNHQPQSIGQRASSLAAQASHASGKRFRDLSQNRLDIERHTSKSAQHNSSNPDFKTQEIYPPLPNINSRSL